MADTYRHNKVLYYPVTRCRPAFSRKHCNSVLKHCCCLVKRSLFKSRFFEKKHPFKLLRAGVDTSTKILLYRIGLKACHEYHLKLKPAAMFRFRSVGSYLLNVVALGSSLGNMACKLLAFHVRVTILEHLMQDIFEYTFFIV